MASEQPKDNNMKQDNTKTDSLDIEASRLVMPICPYCKTEMNPFKYTGYYDSFFGWECECEEIPNSEEQHGEYT